MRQRAYVETEDMFVTRTNIVGKSGPSIDGAGAAKEDESTGAVGAHRGMDLWRCRRRAGSTNAAGTQR